MYKSLLKELTKKNNNIKFDIYGMDNKQPVWADDFKNKVKLSKMALNLSQGKPLKYYSSDRIAQLIGNGILTFVEESTKLNRIFSNKEVVFYKNIKDLSKKIETLMNNDPLRIKISRAGYNKYHRYMNSNVVAEYIINKIFKINSQKKYLWER